MTIRYTCSILVYVLVIISAPASASPTFTGVLAGSTHLPTLSWSLVSNTLTGNFSVSNRNGNWFGFGFSSGGLMVDSSVIVYSFEGGAWRLREYPIGGDRLVDPATFSADYTSPTTVTESGGVTTFSFSRGVSANGFAINTNNQAVIWAVGSSAFVSEHGSSSGTDYGASKVNFITGEINAVGGNDLHTVHGVFMFLAWGVLVPVGVWVARYKKNPEDATDAQWFQLHRAIQMIGFLFFVIGFVVAITMQSEDKKDHFKSGHPFVGLVMMVLGTLQVVGGVLHASHEASWRPAWDFAHRNFGRIIPYLGVLVIFSGLNAIEADDIYSILFIIWIVIYHVVLIVSECKLRQGKHKLDDSVDLDAKT